MKTRSKTAIAKSGGGTSGGTRTSASTVQKSRGGAPKHNQNAKKSGHWARKAILNEQGLAVIDRRTTIGRALTEKDERISADLGGKNSLSQLKQDTKERYLRLTFLADSLWGWVFKQRTLVRKRAVLPVINELVRIEESASRLANQLGLERKPRAIPSLQDYLAEHAKQNSKERNESNES